MPDSNKTPGSFDVNEELELLLKSVKEQQSTLHRTENPSSSQHAEHKRPVSPAQGRPAAPAQGRPAAPAQGRPAAPVQGRPAAPAQGRPVAPAQGRPAAPAQGRPVAPAQGRPATPAQGRPATPAQGRPAAPAQGRPVAPAQGRPVAPAQGRPAAPAQGRPVAPAQGRPASPAQGRPASPAQGRPASPAHSPARFARDFLASKTSRFQRPVQPRIVTSENNGLKMYEDKTDYSKMNDKEASYYHGEVYFAAKKPVHPVPNANPSGAKGIKGNLNLRGGNVSEAINKFIHEGGRKALIIYLAVLVAISAIMSIYIMSLINDILAFNRSTDVKTITVSEDASTNQIIGQLDRAGLIKHSTFCKFFMTMTKSLHNSKGDPVYLSGVYYLTPSMGLEKMLLSCQEIQKAETVRVTIPEGYTIEQIAKKLEKSGVCMSDELFNNLKQAEFSYKFLGSIENKSARYQYLEGYLYPDTYEFYVDQNASSVINKMLENFGARWTDEYQARAKEIGMTVDEVMTLASIIQKEAANAEQMPVIAKIFINRLNSSAFPSLQSDATNIYVDRYIKPNVTGGEFDNYWAKYSTYRCIGLPAGPICCPGDDAIRAVLWPAETDAYYFCHDKAGEIYTAKTEAEHQANYTNALSDKDKDDMDE